MTTHTEAELRDLMAAVHHELGVDREWSSHLDVLGRKLGRMLQDSEVKCRSDMRHV